MHVATAVERGAGVRRAVRAARLPRSALHEAAGDWTVAGGLRAGRDLLSRDPRPTAVLAASDEMALGVLMAAREAGLRVPQDLSVAGVDDHELSHTHALTTVAQPVEQLGEAAAGLVVAALTPGQRADRGRRVVRLPTQLVVRGTTAPPAGGYARRPKALVSSSRSAGSA